MPAKHLIPFTIIPKELYVLRDADRQLRKVVEDMGRPGYVLVARQMGKTNLLLNAKRELETLNDVFAYVDLSKPFETERDCFRSIIDVAVESRQDRFAAVKETLGRARTLSRFAPYKEHENELRLLLSCITGKLVICLDEIDSLTNTDFSDRIFAQIRSIYFSRMNTPEYTKLTYVLSGVVEPNEIIKDKRISPFNIGQKIYLDDFSRAEFADFLSKAELRPSQEVSDRIFEWTSGNPRITWDLCSELEDLLLAGQEVTPSLVDSTVDKLYLRDFNHSPVDHIRELVADDEELRGAVMVLARDEALECADTLKSKLYLAGVIGPDFSKRLTIKNRIICAALNEQWIEEANRKKRGLLKIAEDKYSEEKYREALAVFEEYLANNSLPEDGRSAYSYKIGVSAYHAGQYEKALKHLTNVQFNKEDEPKLYRDIALKIGICHFQLSQYTESRARFVDVMSFPKRDALSISAQLNLGGVLVYESQDPTYSEATRQFQDVLKVTAEPGHSWTESQAESFRRTALYNLGRVYEKSKQLAKARGVYEEAIPLCSGAMKPFVLVAIYQITSSPQEKRKILGEIADGIVTERLTPGFVHPDDRPMCLSVRDFYYLLMETYLHEKSKFEVLADYLKSLSDFAGSNANFLYRLAVFAYNEKNQECAKSLLLDALSLKDALSEHNIYQLLCLICNYAERPGYFDKYFEAFVSQVKPDTINWIDLRIFSTVANQLIDKSEFAKALLLLQIPKDYFHTVPRSLLINYALLYFLELKVYDATDQIVKLRELAQETIEFLGSLQPITDEVSLLGKKELDYIKNYALSCARLPSIPATTMAKIGRNEKVSVRYTDGTIIRGVKYKRVTDDLTSGKCTMIQE